MRCGGFFGSQKAVPVYHNNFDFASEIHNLDFLLDEKLLFSGGDRSAYIAPILNIIR